MLTPVFTFASTLLVRNSLATLNVNILPSNFPLAPLPPTGFNVTSVYHLSMTTIVTLDWDPPRGSGPEFSVHNYTIIISPRPPIQPALDRVPSPPWNVTLALNVMYTISVAAINCFGMSETRALSSTIGFSEFT